MSPFELSAAPGREPRQPRTLFFEKRRSGGELTAPTGAGLRDVFQEVAALPRSNLPTTGEP